MFLRLRKAFRKKDLPIATVAPFLSTGAYKMGARLIATIPGAEAAVLDELSGVQLDPDSVILVGERAAVSSGTLSACLRLAEQTGARLAWVPRRAGDRGAVEAGCLPNLLPGGRPVADPAARIDVAATWGIDTLPSLPGRDGDEILISASDDELAALVVAGVDPSDFLDPEAALEGLEEIDFIVSLETRASLVTERADVVLPVSLMQERAGHFLNWEGRAAAVPGRPPQRADHDRPAGAGRPGRRTGPPAGCAHGGGGRGRTGGAGTVDRRPGPTPDVGVADPGVPGEQTVVLATWRLALDDSRGVAGEPYLMRPRDRRWPC